MSNLSNRVVNVPAVAAIVNGIAALRAKAATSNDVVQLSYHTSIGDGGHGQFRYVAGAAAGTYVDNNGTIIVPTGGDGSAAWLRVTGTAEQGENFGLVTGGVTDNQAALTAAQTAQDVTEIKPGSFGLSSTLILQALKTIIGAGDRVTIIKNNGASFGISTVGGVAYAKQYSQWLQDIAIDGTNATTPAASAVRFIDVGKSGAVRVMVSNHETGFELAASVGTHLVDCTVTNVTNGIKAGAVAGETSVLGATTIAAIDKAVITVSVNAIADTGFLKALHINESTIEANTNIWDEASGGGAENIVFRNCWFEANTNYDLGTIISPVIDTCKFVGDIDITNGIAPVFKNIHITGTTNWPRFYTNSETSEVSATGQTFNNKGQHGLSLSMPQIGSASTPVDKQETQGLSQSKLIGELSGTLFGYAQPTQNLNQTNVGQTGYVGGKNYWPYGTGVTVTTGQPDMFGTSTAVKLTGAGVTRGSTDIATTIGNWYVIQMAFEMVAPNEVIGLNVGVGSTGGALDKRNKYRVADTNLRVVHMLFKADATTHRPAIVIPTSGVIVHRFCMFAGAQLKPMIPEGTNVPVPFIQEFNHIKTYGVAAPTTGTWAVGDRLIQSTPSVGSPKSWVCTVAGTPGTWVSEGNL